MTISEKLILNIGLSHCYFLKGREKLILYENLDSLSSFLLLSLKDISELVKRNVRPKIWEPELLRNYVQKTIKTMEIYDIKLISFYDSSFPPQLREIPDYPFSVFYRGKLPNFDKPMLSMVGTRHPTGEGIAASLDISKNCAECHIPIVSGLAYGIDTFSHRGCVDGAGYTLAVMACSPEIIYPRTNKRLAAKILETGGCILSEYAPGTNPLPYRFPERNRIISGLSRSTLIVEAPKKSGALITADFALEQGRDVFICKQTINSLQNDGGRHLYSQGACLIENAQDILNEWKCF